MTIQALPNYTFACEVAVKFAQEGTRCKLYRDNGIWYVAI